VVDELSDLLALAEEINGCSACFPDGGNRPVFVHAPGSRVMIVGQAPSLTDSETGRTFSGPGGKRLRQWLADAGVPEEDVSFSALTKCYPGRSASGKGDRVPSRGEILACRGFLEREIRVLDPAILLLVGGLAIAEFLGRAPLADVVGKAFDGTSVKMCRVAPSVSVVPLPHCSGASLWLNRPEHRDLLDVAIDRIRELYASPHK
jgi:uracil-DNA glycosylase family 4